MKRIFCLFCLFSILVAPALLSAQGRHRGPGWGWGWSPGFQGGCRPVDDLGLTAEQRAAVEKIESRYEERINVFQNKLTAKRLEMQQVFRDAKVDEATVRARAGELAELQNQSRQATLDYQLAVRAVLSPEQLRTWCATMESCPPMRGRGANPWRMQ